MALRTQKYMTESAQDKKDEQMEKTGTVGDITPVAVGDMFVFANLQTGQRFTLANGKQVVFNGVPVTDLVGRDGNFIPGGKFGVTKVSAEDWDEIKQTYGEMAMFKNGLVFAAKTMDEGQSKALERSGLRHGFEQIDPNTRKTKPLTPE